MKATLLVLLMIWSMWIMLLAHELQTKQNNQTHVWMIK